jgi:helicase
MLKGDTRLVATPLGNLVSMLYVDPLSAATMLDGLDKAENITELTLMHLVCKTPDMRQLYLRSGDYELINDFVITHAEEFSEIPNQFKDTDYEWFLAEVKTALLVLDWINERPMDDISKSFNVGEGDIHALAELSEWLMHSLSRLARVRGHPAADMAGMLEKRIHYGARPELMELVGIRGIGRVRARRLYDSGLKTVEDIRKADPAVIGKLIGTKTAGKLLREIGMHIDIDPGNPDDVGSKTMDSLIGNEQSTFSDFEK